MNEQEELEIHFSQSSVKAISEEELKLVESVMPDLVKLLMQEQAAEDD